MAVHCRQTAEGASYVVVIEPHFDGQTDADLLALKAKGAHDKGWAVEFTGPRSFTASKVRWASEAACVREFWADD
jgi:hypothetical protein